MGTDPLWRRDPYLAHCHAQVVMTTPDGAVALDRTVFFAAGGGQPGDHGTLRPVGGNAFAVRGAGWGEAGVILHYLEAPEQAPDSGTEVELELDWDLRHRRMRMHTALHLLSVIVPCPVTGGAIGEEKSRLDFDMPEAPEKESLEARLNELVLADHPVSEEWIGTEELAARPDLVKTVGARPPETGGQIRLVRIGEINLQPCGGTHVRSTAEIGALRIGKIEKKGRANRRINLHFAQ